MRKRGPEDECNEYIFRGTFGCISSTYKQYGGKRNLDIFLNTFSLEKSYQFKLNKNELPNNGRKCEIQKSVKHFTKFFAFVGKSDITNAASNHFIKSR